MTVLNLPAYYFPEQISSSHLTSDLEDAYINAGFDIKICSPTPTRGITDEVYEEYKNKKSYSLKDGHISVTRFYMFREGKNPLLRALRYVLVNIIQYIKSGSLGEVDVIVGASTPPTQGILCALIKKKLSKKFKKTIPFIFNLQDVFPDSLVYTGLTKTGSLLYKIGDKIAMYTYKNADKIIVISNDTKQNIINKGVPEEKIEVISNWIDSTAVHPVPKEENYLYDKFGIPKDKFLAVYAGNLGYAQNIDVIIASAQKLKDYNDIHFVIFGKGAQEDEYREKASKLENISFFPIQPYSAISYVYSLGDVSIVPCKKGFGGSAMPSKIWSIMATGTPVLASFDADTDLEKLIVNEQVGLFAEAENEDALTENILALANDFDRRKSMGNNAREYVVQNLSKEICTQRYIDVMLDTVREKK